MALAFITGRHSSPPQGKFAFSLALHAYSCIITLVYSRASDPFVDHLVGIFLFYQPKTANIMLTDNSFRISTYKISCNC